MPARKGEEAFTGCGAMRQIGFQNALDGARRVGRLDVAVKFAAERGVGAEAAADEHVIALDRIVAVLNLAGEQADFGNEMLCARVMAAGEMNVDRRIERNTRLTPGGDLCGVPLGVGGGELAAGIAGAGD